MNYETFVNLLFKEMPTETETILHAAVGISGEAGELLDAVKKTWVYNKPLDRINLREELGDILFYLQKLASILGTTIEDLIVENRIKLTLRYPAGIYTDAAAQTRLDKSEEE